MTTDGSHWGDIATLATAALSAVATAGAWLAAHQSSKTAEALTRIERDRRREERRPQLDLSLGGRAQDHSTLVIHLAGPDELAEVEFLSVRVDDDDKDRSHVLGIGAPPE
ncbi:hypothetical protein [Streptomyces sp. NPDC059271]|uniref:hypothetical protein n=1 Tax=Streptomyces sp. NPDC059271 TaxID=3346799 RepID=UPI0036ADA794